MKLKGTRNFMEFKWGTSKGFTKSLSGMHIAGENNF